jgi:hypothetical protein
MTGRTTPKKKPQSTELQFDPESITPDEMIAVEDLTGKEFTELFGASGGAVSARGLKAFAAIAFKRADDALTWQEAWDKGGARPLSEIIATDAEAGKA